MGLDASVMCRCWQDGLTTEPPVPRELVYVSEGALDVDLNFDTHENEVLAFDSWAYSHACPHENLWLACEWIGNWGMVGSFRQAVQAVSGRFPRLETLLPSANGGRVDVSEAPAILHELALFRAELRSIPTFALVDVETGTTVWTTKQNTASAWHRRGGDLFCLEDGWFVVRREGREAFRSAAFVQLVESARVQFVDDLTGVACLARDRVTYHVDRPGDPTHVDEIIPQHLRAECRVRETGYLGSMCDRLEILFRASLATGNPVYWN